MQQFHAPSMITIALRKVVALLFLVAIALVPVAVVVLGSGRGGIWVAGYVTGIITVPLIAMGALRAIYTLLESNELRVFISFVVFGVLVILTSVTAALWSFFH
jgi:hypothetical protein